jgi:hypothetical protein
MPTHEHNPFTVLPGPGCPDTGAGAGVGVEDDEYGVCQVHSPPMRSHELRNLHLQGQIVHLSVLPASAVS